MVNAMTREGNSQRIKRRVLTPQIRDTIVQESSGADSWIEEDVSLARLDTEQLRDSLSKRRLSKKDMEFNRRVLHIREIAHRHIDLERLIKERYQCGGIMALSLALKEIEQYMEETRQLYRSVSDPQDKEALAELMHILIARAAENYWGDLLELAQMVGAVRTVNGLEGPDDELIGARFALDAIWDEEATMRRGATGHNRRSAKELARKLDADPKVDGVRRSLGIPEGGFKELDAAHDWSQKSAPDSSRRDEAYRQELVWWESFAWPRYSARPVARGYIMLDLPAMNAALERLVSEYQLDPEWYRLLPLYLIRGRLEPPPRQRYRHRPMKELHEEIYELSKKHKPCWKAVLYFRYGLTDEDWSKIAGSYPAANNKRWSLGQKELIRQLAERIAKRKRTLDPGRVHLTNEERFEQYFRQVRSRMKTEKM